MGKFSNYQSKPVVSNLLPAGRHTVRIIECFETDSFTSHDKTRKEKEFEWVNPTDQLLIHVVSTDNKGSLIHRLQGQGWRKFADLTDEEIKSKKYTNASGYACITNKKGELERVEDPDNTAKCERIMDRFMASLGIPEGSGLEAIDEAIASKKAFDVVVINDEYDGKDQLKIASFHTVVTKSVAPVDIEA